MDMDEIFRRAGEAYGGSNMPLSTKWVKFGVLLIVVALGVMTSIYIVPTDSAGVIQRLGKYNRTTEPGIHLKIPFWVEAATPVPVKKVQKEEFGFRTLEAGVDSKYLGIEEIDAGRSRSDDLQKLIRESGARLSRTEGRGLAEQAKEVLASEYIMLTGGLNIVDVEWIVQYKIKDAENYLFNVRDPREAIRDASEAVMRLLVGNGSVDEAITIGRIEYENSAQEMVQRLLDEYETGIHVVTVKIQSSNPPQRVRPAFNEVNKALQQKEQRINEAMGGYNETIPKTKGEAKKLIESAKGYAAERVNRAEGDVARFESVFAEYQKAPEITRQRMYFETMSKLLPLIPEKWIIEQGGADGGILMKLDLDAVE